MPHGTFKPNLRTNRNYIRVDIRVKLSREAAEEEEESNNFLAFVTSSPLLFSSPPSATLPVKMEGWSGKDNRGPTAKVLEQARLIKAAMDEASIIAADEVLEMERLTRIKQSYFVYNFC